MITPKTYQFSPISTENECPKDSRHEEEESQGEKNSWQGNFSSRQEAALVFLHHVDGKVWHRDKISVVWVVAVVIEQGV